MKIEFLEQSLEQKIVKEILQWSKNVLETNNPSFNSLPACPFAEKAWKDDKVAIIFKYEDSFQCLYSVVSAFDDNFDLTIIIDMNFNKNPEAFHDYLYEMNNAISEGMFINKDVWLMGFHPHDEGNEFVADVAAEFEPIVDKEYAMIFIQRLSKLQESADKLAKRGYYKVYEEDYNAQELFEHRSNLYRRLKNGDASQKENEKRWYG
jgi:hypothetical protein|tara:strand:+ start:189 stop:809 length:621 start_codon:yes stop_codon:yes gene_type:complete